MFSRTNQLLTSFSRAFLLRDVRDTLNQTHKIKIAASSTLSITNSFAKIAIPAAFSQSIKMMTTNQSTMEILGVDFSAGNLLWMAILFIAWQRVEGNFRNALTDDAANAFKKKIVMSLMRKPYEQKFPLEDETKNKIRGAEWLMQDLGPKLSTDIVNQLLPAAFDTVTGIMYVWVHFGMTIGVAFLIYALASILILNILLISYTKTYEKSEALRKSTNKTHEHSHHLLYNLKTIEMYNHTEQELKRNEANLEEMSNDQLALDEANRTYDYLTIAPIFIAYFVFGCYLGNICQAGMAAIQPILFLFTYIGMFGADLNKLNTSIKSAIQTRTTFEQCVLPYIEKETPVNSTHTKHEENEEKEKKYEAHPVKPSRFEAKAPSIEFKDVTFSYPHGTPILKKASFKIEEGKRTALYGNSGRGKSTLLDLIMGFAHPEAGSIEINGKDITKFSQEELKNLRHQIAVVFQTPDIFIFKSIEDNITYGSPKPLENAKVNAIMEQAQLSTLIKRKKEKCDQNKLSGGEQKRIGFARCLAKLGIFDSSETLPAIVLLDEPITSLDTNTAKNILETMRLHTQGRTVIYTALESAHICEGDNVIVLKNGPIIEQLTYQEFKEREEAKADFNNTETPLASHTIRAIA